MSEWRAYVELSAGAVAVAAGRALGADAADFAGLRAVGSAYGTADLLRNVTRHAREGRCLLPEEALARHGLTLHDAIMAPDRATAVVSDLVAEGLRWDAAGRGRRHASLRAAALVGILARRDLRRMAKGAAASRGLVDRLAVTMAAAAGVPRI
jgi:phytoene synthase